MLYCIFDTVLGDAILVSLDVESVLKLLFSFNQRNCITESIYKILDNNKEEKEWNEISQIELPESFIHEFQDRISWYYISCDQNLCLKTSSGSFGTELTGIRFPLNKIGQRTAFANFKIESIGDMSPDTKICQRSSSASSGIGSTGDVFLASKI